MSEKNSSLTRMRAEINEIPDAAARLIAGSKQAVEKIAEAVRIQAPAYAATIARGSSDHAAGFLKYAIELEAGLPVASIGPSVASIYQRQMRMAHSLTLAISQSGKSPDIVAMAENARRGGSLVVAMTNVPALAAGGGGQFDAGSDGGSGTVRGGDENICELGCGGAAAFGGGNRE